ncbi:MAG: D-glucuronyl C5-epimerase family protein [candidate division Zixibacteria bacterium]
MNNNRQFGVGFLFRYWINPPILLIIGVLILSCSSDKIANMNQPEIEFNYDDYDIQQLDLSERWFDYMYPINTDPAFPHDENGIILFQYLDQYYYHPYQIANQGLWYLAGYQQTSDTVYLDLVTLYSDKLLEIGERSDDGIYFPYTFNYRLHGGAQNGVMLAPWYSGFAQGFALSFFSRIYETTGDPFYKAAADSVFRTFCNFDRESEYTFAMVDPEGYYWAEEYPFNPPTHVINGFTFVVIALGDYYAIENSETCELLIKGSCTTLAAYFDEFRNPGGISYYCIYHKTPLLDYHDLVIKELRYITRIAGDSLFSDFADTLFADYQP